MKIRVWVSVVDSGDGEHIGRCFSSREAIKKHYKLDEDGLDKYGMPVEIYHRVIETDEYEVIS